MNTIKFQAESHVQIAFCFTFSAETICFAICCFATFINFSLNSFQMMSDMLQSSGENVQRRRVRESINRTSPFPVVHRLSKTVKHRRYSVPMSNSYWHIDGHMKLIRYAHLVLQPI